VLQKANPQVVLLVTVIIVTLSDITIRVVQNHLIKKRAGYETLEKQKRFHRTINKINKFFREQESLNKASAKREHYAATRKGQIATFLFAIFCYLPFIPDIISTRLLYKKIKFPYFVIAVIIGKTISHGVFIFLGKSLFGLLGW
jgi:membrane protein YqaA with SNARE-associated domain